MFGCGTTRPPVAARDGALPSITPPPRTWFLTWHLAAWNTVCQPRNTVLFYKYRHNCAYRLKDRVWSRSSVSHFVNMATVTTAWVVSTG